MVLSMKVNKGEILEKARRKVERKQLGISLPVELYKEFKEACKGLYITHVVEELIRAFLRDRGKGDSDKDGT